MAAWSGVKLNSLISVKLRPRPFQRVVLAAELIQGNAGAAGPHMHVRCQHFVVGFVLMAFASSAGARSVNMCDYPR
jgi:hypothetical protein